MNPEQPQYVLLFTDVEDSTRLTSSLGDEAASVLWANHDRIARRLLREWDGREIDKSDGFLLLFKSADHALGYAAELQRQLGMLNPPVMSRAGIHRGRMVLRENDPIDVASGAKPIELDGVARAVASRIMSLARGGQTLVSTAAASAMTGSHRLWSHGFWRLKGIPEPLEILEASDIAPVPPRDTPKSYRVVRCDDGWSTVAAIPHSLPAERDGFIGRDSSLTTVATLLEGGARLVTIVGIGGIGKTRLALRYARDWLGDYPGGAWFCDLSAARGLDGLLHATAQGLGLVLGRNEPVEVIGDALAARGPSLVILDNFEQVARHAEETIGLWLKRAPAVQILVTSREVLSVAGETAMALEPLQPAEAVALLRQRASEATAPCHDETEPVLRRLVDLLDRLPLAIELAASRMRVLPPREIIERISERFRLLASPGGRQQRQVTLRATLDWSWDLLTRQEQSALAQLSVFQGGFRLDAAEAVVGPTLGKSDPWPVDLVQSLIDRSLLRRVGESRFDMLRTVHDYASDRLVRTVDPPWSNDTAAATAQQRHWLHFASREETAAIQDRCADTDNLIAACARAAPTDVASAVVTLGLAWEALRLVGPFRALLDLAQRVEASVQSPTSAQRAAIDRVVGQAHALLGHSADAERRYSSALSLSQSCNDQHGEVEVRCRIANMEVASGRFGSAASHLDAAGLLAAAATSPRLRLRLCNGWGALHLARSKFKEAFISFERALDAANEIGDLRWKGGILGNLGMIEQTQGRLESARPHYLAGLELASSVGDRQWEGNIRCNLGLLLHETGESRLAGEELSKSLKLARLIGHRRLEATVLCNLGIVAAFLGDTVLAAERHLLASQIAGALGSALLQAQALGHLGVEQARLGQFEAARHALDEAAIVLSGSDDRLTSALIAFQRATVAGLAGDARQCQTWLERGESDASSIEMSPTSELARAMATARASLASCR